MLRAIAETSGWRRVTGLLLAYAATAPCAAFDERSDTASAAPPDRAVRIVVGRDGRPIPTEIVPPAAQAKLPRDVRSGPSVVPAVEESSAVFDARAEQQIAPGSTTNDASDEPAVSQAQRHPRNGGLQAARYRDRRYIRYPRYRGYVGPHDGYGGYRPPAIRRAYELGRRDERLDVQRSFNDDDMNQRRERGLAAQSAALEQGLERLAAGDYRAAAAALTLAARLDEGDSACRVHLSQAQLALGHFDEAGKTLRRALELQSELALQPLDLARHYPSPQEFDAHIGALSVAAAAQRVDADGVFLLGFMEYQRGNTAAAYACFARVASDRSRPRVITDLLAVTRPAGR